MWEIERRGKQLKDVVKKCLKRGRGEMMIREKERFLRYK